MHGVARVMKTSQSDHRDENPQFTHDSSCAIKIGFGLQLNWKRA
jgi:hypothetical protein